MVFCSDALWRYGEAQLQIREMRKNTNIMKAKLREIQRKRFVRREKERESESGDLFVFKDNYVCVKYFGFGGVRLLSDTAHTLGVPAVHFSGVQGTEGGTCVRSEQAGAHQTNAGRHIPPIGERYFEFVSNNPNNFLFHSNDSFPISFSTFTPPSVTLPDLIPSLSLISSFLTSPSSSSSPFSLSPFRSLTGERAPARGRGRAYRTTQTER